MRKPRDEGKVTLGMVAKASGVSPSTVSRILNGTAVVSKEKREAIDKAIADLGFVPNPIARGLALPVSPSPSNWTKYRMKAWACPEPER